MRTRILATAIAMQFVTIAVPAASGDRGYAFDSQGSIWRDGYDGCVYSEYREQAFYDQCEQVAAAPVEPVTEAPAPAPAIQVERLVLNTDAHFDFDKATLKPEAKARLDELMDRVKGATIQVISVTGHTCSMGSEAYNQGLSERRARSVSNYLVEQGVDAGLINASGRGESQPIASNETREGRARNRRVEIEIKSER